MDLGVGVVGVNGQRGWARESHVPAIRATPGVRLAGVAGRDRAGSQAAASALGAERAYDDGAALVADPQIDVVVATVPVPAHREVVRAALEAGKHVVTEWPLTPGVEETDELAAAAQASGRHAVVGLQARTSPAVLRAAELLRAGELGRVLTASAVSTTAGFGATVGEHDTYLEDPAAGMNLLTIQGAHTLDLLVHLLGRPASTSVLTSVLHPQPRVEGAGRVLDRVLADHVLVHGRLEHGAPFAVEVAGGRPPQHAPFRLEVVTERAVLELTGGAARGFQSGVLDLSLDGEPVQVEIPDWRAALAPSASNVAGLYAALVHDVDHGDATAPGFADAAALAHLVDGLRDGADHGSPHPVLERGGAARA